MPLLFTPYASNYFLAAIITVMTAWINWRQRKDYPGVYSLAVALTWLALWSLINGVDMMLVQPDQKMAMYFLENLFISLFLVYMLLFVLQYYRLEHYLNLFWRLAIGAWVASGTLLYLINSVWHLHWIRYTPGPPNSNLFYFDRDVIFNISDIILLVVVVVIAAILIYQARPGQRRDIIRASLLVTGLSLPLVLYFIYLFWVDVTIGNVLLALGTCFTDIFISIAVFEDLRNRIEDSTAELHGVIETLHGEIEERQKLEDDLRRVKDGLAERLVDQGQKLAALYDLTFMGSQTPTTADVLDGLLKKISEIMTGQFACFYIVESAHLHLEKHHGLTKEQAQVMESLPSDWLAISPQVRAESSLGASPSAPKILNESGFNACLCKWVYVRDRAIGLLCLFWPETRLFSMEESLLFAALADQVGQIWEETRLRRGSMENAVAQERRRLGRELHDSVTQSLHSLVLAAETAQYLISRPQPAMEKLEKLLSHLTESARQSLKEMRLLIYEMRLSMPGSDDIVDLIKTRLEEVENRAGIKARFDVDKTTDLPVTWNWDLFSIMTEALNNVIKHAHADQVSVSLYFNSNTLKMQVKDNGIGFTPQLSRGGTGMHSMAERADRLGGLLNITSHLGEGTQVTLLINPGNLNAVELEGESHANP